MGFIYSSLNKCDSESWSQFDNRITRMLPFVTGMAYFDLRNYDVRTGEFGAYAEWDRELESLLGYELPDGGYFVKATIAQAYRLHGLGCGLPVYMKLISLNGKLYPYRTYVMMEGRPYSLEFGGGELMPIDDRYVELGCAAAKETQLEAVSAGTGSQRFMRSGSQSGRQQPAICIRRQPAIYIRRQPAICMERQSDETVVRQSGRFPISYGKPVQNGRQQPTICVRQQSEIQHGGAG